MILHRDFPRGFRAALSFSLWLFSVGGLLSSAQEASGNDPLQLFEERIMPIFNSPKPSSCVQCHLSSVDIKDYILPSHTDTFVALRDSGLINLDQPDQSKILTLIRMGEKDIDPAARRIHAKTRQAEYEAFAAWISACCRDSHLRTMPARDGLESIGPEKPLEVVRHARKSRLVESFTRNIWSQRMRCFPCHTPYELDADNPKHQVPAERHREFVEQYGAKMNLFQKTPEETLNRLVAGSKRQLSEGSRPRRKPSKAYPMINLKEPRNSLLILKPTAKVPAKKDDGSFEKPSAIDPVTHMGGLKMHVHDQSYKSLVAWIEDYAAVVGDRYVSAEDLPADNWVPTQRVLRIKDVPPGWGSGSVVQLFVHAKDDNGNWSKEPVAFTQNSITPRRLVNGTLILFRSELQESTEKREQDFPLQPGQYLVKAYVDTSGRLAESPTILLGPVDYIGQAVIEAQWQIGWPKAETISAAAMQK